MTITYRHPTKDELLPFVRTFVDVMNQRMTDEEILEGSDEIELDRSWIADDGERLVGTTTCHSFELNVPGGRTAGLGGLGLVAVVPTHRRRGIMRELLGLFLGDCRQRGDVFAGCFSSEAAIYGRFGFGPATRMARVTLERDRARGLEQIVTPGRIRWSRVESSWKELRDIFERTRTNRPGDLARPDHVWATLQHRYAPGPDGKPIWAAIHEDTDGVADGYVVYRVESKWIDHTAQNEVGILELVGEGIGRLALWRFLAELDLVRTVTDGNARIDEPIFDVLADPRQLRTLGVWDQLWIRLVDVARALSLRTYNVDGTITFAVADPTLSQQAGTYRLVVNDGLVTCERSDAEPDLAVAQRALASVYLGDRSFRSLAESGLVRVNDRLAAARADAMFAVSPAPQCLTLF